MTGELDFLNEWIPEQMLPGTLFVLENAGEVGEKEDPYWAVLSCPTCGTLGLVTRKQVAGLLAVICGSDQCSAQFFIHDSEIVPRKPIAEMIWRASRARWPALHFDFLQRNRYLLDNFDIEPFQRCHAARMIGKQADPPQIQVRQNLGADPDFSLRLALAFRQRRQSAISVETQHGAIADLIDGKSL